MCGQFVLMSNLSIITESFDIREIACEYRLGDPFSPGQQIAAVIRDDLNRLVNFSWGLIPSWAKDPSIGKKLFNARAETLSEKPSFRNAFRKCRCLIIAYGFYEWQEQDGVKSPFYISLKSEKPFAFAGLYETWTSSDGQHRQTCTIITTEPNELIRPIHDRMPVIVPKAYESFWIAPDNDDERGLLSMLKPYPGSEMKIKRAGRHS